METQTEWVLEQMLAGRRLTPLQALRRRGIMRLGARIWDLRQLGYRIKTKFIRVENGRGEECTVAQYWCK